MGFRNPASYDEGVTDSPSRIPGWLPQALGYSVSAACLIWVLHGYPLDELGPALRGLDYRWVALAVAADLAVYVVHAQIFRKVNPFSADSSCSICNKEYQLSRKRFSNV